MHLPVFTVLLWTFILVPGCKFDPDTRASSDAPGGDQPCEAGACSDGILNCGESDVDCGGSCLGCENGESCGGVDDCRVGECSNNQCVTVGNCSPTVNYRSIGSNTGILADEGTASIDGGATTMTFTVGLPLSGSEGGVGTGDEISLGGQIFHIVARQSATEVSVQPAASTQLLSGYEIRRAFQSVQAWEDARQGEMVTEQRREKGIAYKDSVFTEVEITIDGSTTDACHYMWLAAAPGHRHKGIAADSGTDSVVFDPDNDGHVFTVSDDYFRASWLELTDFTGNSSEGFRVNNTGFLLENSLLHDAETLSVDGVYVSQSGIEIEIRNTIMYNIGRVGVHVQDCDPGGGNGDNITVYLRNCTFVRMSQTEGSDFSGGVGYSVCPSGAIGNSVFIVTNTFVDSGLLDAYQASGGGLFTGSDFNASSDDSAPGSTTLTMLSPPALFTNAPQDLHLKSNSALVNAGTDLSTLYSDDIDGAPRGTDWDIGADEFGAP